MLEDVKTRAKKMAEQKTFKTQKHWKNRGIPSSLKIKLLRILIDMASIDVEVQKLRP